MGQGRRAHGQRPRLAWAWRWSLRCECGSRRLRLRGLVRLAGRTMLMGFAWTGLTSAACSAEEFDSLGRWVALMAVQAPCCARTLVTPGERHSAR